MEEWGTVLITSWKCNFSIYLDIQVYYLDFQVYYLDIQVYYLDPSILLGYPSNNHTFIPSIGSLCVGSFYSFNFLRYNRSPEK